jgi:CubicO group peptidase (beta-lactamase class C family)
MGYETAFDLVPRRAHGYVIRNNAVGRADHIDMSVPAGAGGLYGTAADLYRWSEALHGGQAIGALAFARMSGRAGGPFGFMTQDGRPVTYGYGFESEPTRRGLSTFHFGSIDGFKSYLRRYGDDGLTVIVLANQQSVDAGAIGDSVAAIVARTPVEWLFAR